MLGHGAVSPLWDEDESKPAKVKEEPVFFTVLPSLRVRIDAVAGTKKGDLKRWMTDVVESELAVQERLEPEKSRLRAYATNRGLSMKDDRATIIADLVVLGLDALEQKKHSKK